MKRLYIVTGANGFLGDNVVRRLAGETEAEIRALLLPRDRLRSLEGLRCEIYRGDVTERRSLEDIFRVPEGIPVCVIHCAAVVDIMSKDGQALRAVNVEGVKNIAAGAMDIGARMVYVSSVHAIPEKPAGQYMAEIDEFDPERVVGAYARSKAEAAQYVLDMARGGLDACVVHPSGLIGPGDYGRSHLTELIRQLADGQLRVCVKGGYDFADVRDVAAGVVSAAEKGRRGECYILSGHYASLREIADMCCRAAGRKRVRELPSWMADLAAPLCEAYYKARGIPPLFTGYSLHTLRSNGLFDSSKARRELGYTTRSIEDTVRDTVDFLSRRSAAKD